MTAHDHREYVEGCFRCDLSRVETAALEDFNHALGLHLPDDERAEWVRARIDAAEAAITETQP